MSIKMDVHTMYAVCFDGDGSIESTWSQKIHADKRAHEISIKCAGFFTVHILPVVVIAARESDND